MFSFTNNNDNGLDLSEGWYHVHDKIKVHAPASFEVTMYSVVSQKCTFWENFEWICFTAVSPRQVYDQGRHALLPLPPLPQGEQCSPLPTLVGLFSFLVLHILEGKYKKAKFQQVCKLRGCGIYWLPIRLRTWWFIESGWKTYWVLTKKLFYIVYWSCVWDCKQQVIWFLVLFTTWYCQKMCVALLE